MVSVFFRTSPGLSVFSVTFFDVVDKGCHLGLSPAMFFSVTCDVFFCHLKVEALPSPSEKLSPQAVESLSPPSQKLSPQGSKSCHLKVGRIFVGMFMTGNGPMLSFGGGGAGGAVLSFFFC